MAGDATKEETLIEAGIERAYGIITSVRNDAINLFIALTAKKLNPCIKISSYVIDEVNIKKFYHVGADDVISGDSVIGKRLGASMLNSNVALFIEQANTLGEHDSFLVGDVTLKPHSSHVNQTIREADIFRKAGLLIFALRKKNSDNFEFNPDASTLLEAGDTLITFGSQADILRLEHYING
jgi:voltage-gated potassium channel